MNPIKSFFKKIFTTVVVENTYIFDHEPWPKTLYFANTEAKKVEPIIYALCVSGSGLSRLNSNYPPACREKKKEHYLTRADRVLDEILADGDPFYILIDCRVISQGTSIQQVIKHLNARRFYLSEAEAKDALNDHIRTQIDKLIKDIK